MGARGAITGYANAFPEVYAQLWKAYELGKFEEARQLQFKVNSLRKLLQKPAITPHYGALQIRG